MTDTTTLLEPSFADAIAAIEQAAELSEQTRRHWICSLRQITKWLDRPAELIPARWTSVRMPVSQLHHARVGVTAKTFANHKSNARAALRWFRKEHDVPVRGVPLSAEWASLRDSIEDRGRRARLYGLMRYCSGRGIAPGSVDDAILDAYYALPRRDDGAGVQQHRPAFGGADLECLRGCHRRLAGAAAHRAAGQGQGRARPGRTSRRACARDIEAYLAGLKKTRRGLNGKRIRPCQPGTIRTRRAELMAVARMAVGSACRSRA